LALGKSVTVPQACYVFAVHESFCHCVYSSRNTCLTNAEKTGYLSKTIAIFDMHRHKNFIRSGKQIQPAAEQINLVAIPALYGACFF
jgi:hypothetical protein